ncbi:MAG: hypothetical protein JNK14_10225 [Chitinophagaceae bacterium]|nr:hypothetical protein [Chitinophagaceae bacterium]
MKKNKSIIFLSLPIVLSSCFSSMKVRVDALNMPAFKKTYLYQLDYIDKMENNLKDILAASYQVSLRENTLGIVKNFVFATDYVAIEDKPYFDSLFTAAYDTTILKLTNSASDLLASTIDLKTDGSNKSFQDRHESNLSRYRQASAAFRNTLNYFREVLAQTAEMPAEVDKVMNLFSLISANASAVISTFGSSIVSDPMASVIATLPKQYWLKYDSKVNLTNSPGSITQQSLGDISKYVKNRPSRYNLTVARTRFGNSDIAFKMAAPGEFIVKGVRVDADEVIRTSFKVVSQGIKYLAYSAGVPVAGTSGSAKKARIPELDSLEEKSNKLKTIKDKYSTATDIFLSVLVEVADDINTTTPRPGQTTAQMNAAKTAALARIKLAYDTYTKSLSNQ